MSVNSLVCNVLVCNVRLQKQCHNGIFFFYIRFYSCISNNVYLTFKQNFHSCAIIHNLYVFKTI